MLSYRPASQSTSSLNLSPSSPDAGADADGSANGSVPSASTGTSRSSNASSGRPRLSAHGVSSLCRSAVGPPSMNSPCGAAGTSGNRPHDELAVRTPDEVCFPGRPHPEQVHAVLDFPARAEPGSRLLVPGMSFVGRTAFAGGVHSLDVVDERHIRLDVLTTGCDVLVGMLLGLDHPANCYRTPEATLSVTSFTSASTRPLSTALSAAAIPESRGRRGVLRSCPRVPLLFSPPLRSGRSQRRPAALDH